MLPPVADNHRRTGWAGCVPAISAELAHSRQLRTKLGRVASAWQQVSDASGMRPAPMHQKLLCDRAITRSGAWRDELVSHTLLQVVRHW